MTTKTMQLVELDGLQVAVIKNRLETIVRAMTNALLRAGRSGVLNIARDFSCSILTGDAELLAFAESIPVHVMSGTRSAGGEHEAAAPPTEPG